MGEAGRSVREKMEDQAIIDLFFHRSEQAISELSKKYGRLCCKVASNILHNSLDTEECVNDTYLCMWNSVPPQQPNPLMTYVCSITRNLALKKYHASTAVKRNSYYDVALEELESCLSVPDTAESAYSAVELAELLGRFLSALNVENRVVFLRRYWYADSISAIAIRLHMSENQVSVRLHRTRKKLQAYLRKEGVPV